jgi:hypothetical protein
MDVVTIIGIMYFILATVLTGLLGVIWLKPNRKENEDQI